MNSFTDLKNCWVEFKIRDVFLPDPNTIIIELHSGDILHGKVMDLTANGRQGQLLAIIAVEGFKDQVFVPVDRILNVHGSSNR
jgi:hypothetical protein